MYGITETGVGVLTQLDAGYLVYTADGHLSTSDVSICLQLMVDLCTTDGSHGYLQATCHSSTAKLHLQSCSLHIESILCTETVRTMYGHCLGTFPYNWGLLGRFKPRRGKTGLNPVL
jgi:hypothetical protein